MGTPPPPNGIPYQQLIEIGSTIASSALALQIFAWVKQRYNDRRQDKKENLTYEEKLRKELWEEVHELRNIVKELRERLEHCDREVERGRQENFDLRQQVQILKLKNEE